MWWGVTRCHVLEQAGLEEVSCVTRCRVVLQAGSEEVGDGIKGACDTLDDWAPLISVGKGVGNFFSGLGRRLEPAAEERGGWGAGMVHAHATRDPVATLTIKL